MSGPISIIIPVLNEEIVIEQLLTYLFEHSAAEIPMEVIVVDGGSTDKTVSIAQQHHAKVIKTSRRGRAIQMNEGARAAKGEILYFLHADTFPPANFMQEIMDACRDGHLAGCYRLNFDDDNLLLAMYGWFTQFDLPAFRFGDQSLFIERSLFFDIGAFHEDMIVMEDNEIIHRIKQKTSFVILSGNVTTSARKYRKNGVIRLQLIFTLIYILFHLGVSQKILVKIYRTFIRSKS